MNGFEAYIPIGIGVLAVVIILVLIFSLIKVARGNEALVVSGILATDKKGNPKIKMAGGSLVIPFIQKYKMFDLCVRTAERTDDVTKTKTGVPVVIDWAISYSPDTSSPETLQSAVRQFLDKDEDSMEEIIMNVISGGVRAVISNMTPIQVMTGKDTLDDEVQKNIEGQMRQLGFKVILTIQEVRDPENSTYFEDVAAEDRETTRRNAMNITADNDQQIRQKAAEAERLAKASELESEVSIAEAQKDADIKKANYEAETAREQVKAKKAGELQEQEVLKELAERKGSVSVEEENQKNKAAKAAQEVAVTQAETEKKKKVIEAQAGAETLKTEAAGKAEAAKLEAQGQAEAEASKVIRAAEADAEAVEKKSAAEAKAIEVKGRADATAIAAKGKAEAEAIAAKGKAEAEAARALSDASAANDKVNFELKRIEIEQNARVQIVTNVATVMADVGKNARFYDFSGSGTSSEAGGGKDLLTRVLGNIPELIAKADLKNEALSDKPVTDTVSDLVGAIVGPFVMARATDGDRETADSDDVEETESRDEAVPANGEADSETNVDLGDAGDADQDSDGGAENSTEGEEN